MDVYFAPIDNVSNTFLVLVFKLYIIDTDHLLIYSEVLNYSNSRRKENINLVERLMNQNLSNVDITPLITN